MKVLLILVDGMRPGAIRDLPQAQKYIKGGACTLEGRTVMPSVTLPCHMSLFHSVTPERHGTTTNTYAPQVRPIRGLCEVLEAAGKRCAFFYNWDELRDLARPSMLQHAYFCRGADMGWEKTNNMVTDEAVRYLPEYETDFAFLYMGYSDEAGHAHGWMGKEYMEALVNSWENIDRVVSALPKDYTVLITADHGGHGRSHGTDMPEDMLIPIMAIGKDFPAGTVLQNASIMDIAPTVAKLLGVAPDREWEGKCLL